MRRDHFHVQDGQDIPDRDGVMLSGDQEARGHAVTAAGEALQDLGPKFWQHPDWRMHVGDEYGTTVCDLRLSNWAGPGHGGAKPSG